VAFQLNLFISYSRKDEDEAKKVYDDLTRVGLRIWFDRESLLPGQDWECEIKRAIRGSDFVILLLSNNSVDKRGYFQKEVHLAYEAYKSIPPGHIFLIPLRLSDCKTHSSLESIHYVDMFPDWGNGIKKIVSAIHYQMDITQMYIKKVYAPSNNVSTMPKDTESQGINKSNSGDNMITEPLCDIVSSAIGDIAEIAIPDKKWIGSVDSIYNGEIINNIKKENKISVVNYLLRKLSEKTSYQEQVPILLILIGVLNDILPHEVHHGTSDSNILENVKHLRIIGVEEHFPFEKAMALMQATYSDCWW